MPERSLIKPENERRTRIADTLWPRRAQALRQAEEEWMSARSNAQAPRVRPPWTPAQLDFPRGHDGAARLRLSPPNACLAPATAEAPDPPESTFEFAPDQARNLPRRIKLAQCCAEESGRPFRVGSGGTCSSSSSAAAAATAFPKESSNPEPTDNPLPDSVRLLCTAREGFRVGTARESSPNANP